LGARPVTGTATGASLPDAGDAMNRPVFGLRKTWVDPSPGIQMVQIHYTWTPAGATPDWANAEEAVLAPRPDEPQVRSAVLEVPRFVDGAPNYSLHHLFFVVGAAGQEASPVFSEDVVSRELAYEDADGEFTSIGYAWHAVESSPGLEVTNYTSGAMDGLPFATTGADAAREPNSIYEFVRAQPLPHVFRGLVWGIRRSQIRYVCHRVRHGSPNPGDDAENWADNDGAGWTADL
jgi:hypothetical protein